jgi:2-aminobenzoate-CoA ligase
VSAGEVLPKATFKQWFDTTGIRIIDGIGTTEMIHIFISAAGEQIRPGAIGKAVPGYSARVIDKNNNPLPPGQSGRLAVLGPTGCRYLDDERQQEYVINGWNVTGDIFKLDSDGYFWYQGRSDDMIISSGYNIASIEVESAILEHASVLECAVIGIPDENRGNIVKAFIILNSKFEPSDELIKDIQNHTKKTIAPYKYPRRIEFVANLPKTRTGKLQRYKLR